MTKRFRLAWTAFAGILAASGVHAGLLDSEPPDLGTASRGTVVYRMGAVHFEPGGWVDTSVTCTNLSQDAATVALEVFDEHDRRAGALAQATVAAGAKVAFATSEAADAPDAVVVRALPPIDHGKARVSATTTQLACQAVNRMRGADGTTKEAALELIKKVAY